MGRPLQLRSGGRRSRPAALALALLAGSFAVSERAEAQAAQAAPAPTAAPVVLGQVVHQVSQTVQAAGTQVATLQVQPMNVAAPVAVQSPGATTAIAQTNAAGAGASSANSSSTRQTAGQSQGGGAAPASPGAVTAAGQAPAPAPASGRPAQASEQASQTAQNAGAQATTVQVAPVNIAIPITIGSPGSSIVIVQTNAAASGANAGNSSSTMQTSGQAATGSPGALPGQPGTAAPGTSPPAAVPPGLGGTGSVLPFTSSGAPWNWNWVWNWTIEINLPSVRFPAVAPWAFRGGEPGTTVPARPERAAPVPTRHVAAPSARNADGAGLNATAAPPEAGQGVSSSIVQRPIASSNRTLEPFVALPLPPQPALSGGAAFVPAGLLVGALALLALYLGSLGLLFGRLSLASAPWRHQAYLAPLQRPG